MLIRHADSVAIVAVDGDALVAVRQPRAGAGEATLELPSGKLEAGEGPDAAVRRELAEECGLDAAEWRRLGAFWAVPAYSTEYVHVYEATRLSPTIQVSEADAGEEVEVERVPLAEALVRLSDAVSIAAVALWQRQA